MSSCSNNFWCYDFFGFRDERRKLGTNFIQCKSSTTMNRTIDIDIHESFIFLRRLLHDISYFLNIIISRVGTKNLISCSCDMSNLIEKYIKEYSYNVISNFTSCAYSSLAYTIYQSSILFYHTVAKHQDKVLKIIFIVCENNVLNK